ncbi:unnamed protein product, partial [Polarella glacialis]
ELFALNPPGFAESVAYVLKLVQEQIDAGIAPERIVLAGFSQGGAVVLEAALGESRTAVGGVLVLSSFLGSKLPKSGSAEALPPVHFFHGEADPVVPMDWGQRSFSLVQAAGAGATFRSYPDMQHSLCQNELHDIAAALSKLLGSEQAL